MNLRLVGVELGRVTFAGIPEQRHANPVGHVHGGWYGTLLDSAMGCAVQTRLPAGRGYTTLEFKVNITRPVPVGMEVEAVAECQHAGRSTAVARGEVRGVGDGKLYATGSTTCFVFETARSDQA
ncbi:MAG: PaaI family thioesterase [Pseudomonadota bacterium]